MSDLLAHYIGVEVLTSADPFDGDSKEGKDLISRVITTLYTSLASSEDHILETIMKLRAPFDKDTPKKDISVYSELFNIILKKAKKRQDNDITYMRYVLVYRLWKLMVKEKDETKTKEMIIKKASKRLKPPPGFITRRSALPKALPKPPENTRNITEFFLRKTFNVRETVKKFVEETSKAAHQMTMFPSLGCNPRLLNPKTREKESLPPLNAPIQEFATFMSTADDVWQRLHGEPHSESSVFEKVTTLKKIPICTPNRMYNLLHNHYSHGKAEQTQMRKRALQEACFRDIPFVGGIISSHRSLSDLGLTSPNGSNTKNRDSPTAKAHKRRILMSPDVHMSKKSKSDLWDGNHIHRPSLHGGGNIYSDLPAKSFCKNPLKSVRETAQPDMTERDRESGCSSKINLIADVKSEVLEDPKGSHSNTLNVNSNSSHSRLNVDLIADVKSEAQEGPKGSSSISLNVEPNGSHSRSLNVDIIADVKSEAQEDSNSSHPSSSSNSASTFDDPELRRKLAIEKEVEQTLQMLQKSKPAPAQPSSSSDASLLKVEDPGRTVGLETPNCSRPEGTTNWSSLWGSYNQQHDLNSTEDIWLDELLSYPSSTAPEGQDYWTLFAGDDTYYS